MARQVAHDDDVGGSQFEHEHLCDINPKGVVIDRPVEQDWRDEAKKVPNLLCRRNNALERNTRRRLYSRPSLDQVSLGR
jgi:hypothetical protein